MEVGEIEVAGIAWLALGAKDPRCIVWAELREGLLRGKMTAAVIAELPERATSAQLPAATTGATGAGRTSGLWKLRLFLSSG